MRLELITEEFADQNFYELTIGEGDVAFEITLTDSDEVSNLMTWLVHEIPSLERENRRLEKDLYTMRNKLADLKGEVPF